MEYIAHSHRFADRIIAGTPSLQHLWDELTGAITAITEDRLIAAYYGQDGESPDSGPVEFGKSMSLSRAINNLLKKELEIQGWTAESALFQGPEYVDKRWRLDFSKYLLVEDDETLETGNDRHGIAVEVAFNHGEAIAWNLLKPVMAGELNHVEQETEIGSGIGVVICATEALKQAGAFDNAVGAYDKFLRYLKPMRNQLTIPMMIIGLNPPSTFRIDKTKDPINRRTKGQVVPI